VRLLHPLSGNHSRHEASPPPAMFIATCARDLRWRRQACRYRHAIRQRPAKIAGATSTAMYNYASPLPAPKRQTKAGAELLHVMNSAILCWPIQAWVRGRKPVPSMNGHYRNRCG